MSEPMPGVRARKVTVIIEEESGARQEHLFFLRDDEPFDVGFERQSGFPKAERGATIITLPRWPSGSYYSPASDDGQAAAT